MATKGLQRLHPAALKAHMTRNPGQPDESYLPLFDSAAYTSGTTTLINFFSTPQGQGTTSAPGASGAKTLADTNLTNAGLLALGNRFYCAAIEMMCFPGVTPGQAYAANAAATVSPFVDDMYTLGKSGVGTLMIGTAGRPYAQDTPLQVFTQDSGLSGFASSTDTTTAAASHYSSISYAKWSGKSYDIVPVYIEANQFFQFVVTWPAAITLPSGTNARLFCRLLGRFIRDSQ
jgi:hypothetical protein